MPIKIVDSAKHHQLSDEEQLVSMTKEVIDQMVLNFRDRVRLHEGGQLLERDKNRYFPWQELEDQMRALGPYDPELGRGVKIHFGLEHDQMRYGLSLFKFTGMTVVDGIETLTYDQASVDLPDFIIRDKHLEALSPEEKEAWASTFRHHFKSSVQINHDIAFTPMGPLDTLAVVLPYELEVERLYRDNQNDVSEVANPYVRVTSICEMRGDGDGGMLGFRHGTALNMAKFNGPEAVNFLNNENSASLFHYHGADFGNLCPPRCGKYEVPAVLV